jgi:nucleotide-binding universal stress UspA family protein
VTTPGEGAGALSGPATFADVLCAVDGTDASLAAVEQAGLMAGPDGRLTLLAVTSFEAESAFRSPAIGPLHAKHILDSAVLVANEAGVECQIEVDPAGPPSHVVLDWAAERDLLAMGAPTTSWFGALFAGGVAEAAESLFSTPLLVARPTPAGPRSHRSILVASDGLDGSDELVELAGRLAKDEGASMILLHAIGLESKARRSRVEKQAELLELTSPGMSELRFERGGARTVIPETASAMGASLVVMSSRRLQGLRAIGSVSRRVVHHGDFSVLLVPPERLRQD